jgi:hypothetical protein
MTDQKNSSPDQKDSSPLTAERRRRMREAAEAAARESPGEWRNHEDNEPFYVRGITCDVLIHGEPHRGAILSGNLHLPHEACERHVVETQPSAVLALLDALEEQERERDALREKLAAAEERDNDRRNDAWEESERG